jgi:hypothetical protein
LGIGQVTWVWFSIHASKVASFGTLNLSHRRAYFGTFNTGS